MTNRFQILLSYLVLSAVPFVPYFYGRMVESPAWLMSAEIGIWCGVWMVFSRHAVFHWFLLPAFILLPADLYLLTQYGRGISARHVGMLLDTSTWEMAEFFGGKLWLMLAAMLLCGAWWEIIRRATRREPHLNWAGNLRKIAILVLATLSIHISYWKAAFEAVELADTRPFGLFAVAFDYAHERQRLADFQSISHSFHFAARQAHASEQPLVIVMVIGESSRADRWSLNGYTRETNPLLAKERNLINAPDVITPVSSTLLSLPIMLSRKGTQNTFKTGFGETSLISAFKEAGFKTYWLSNQIPFGEYDTPVSTFAKEADVVQFLNLGSYSETSSLDEILFAPMKNALAAGEPKKLIILHTLGNHWNYSRRHPKAFDHWQPSLFDVAAPDHTDVSLKIETNNSYDNSVLYTDWFLSQIIKTLRDAGGISAMLYISDHGENLHDGNCDYVLHGHNSQADFHVPMVLWYSDQYQHIYPKKMAQMRRNATTKLSTDAIFHSLLDMADIHYKSEQPEWSIVSGAFKPHKRYVDSYGWADYDHANFIGDCKEVIDKAMPLPRSRGPMVF